MGLDITHYKATLKLPANSELIIIGGQIRSEVGAETRESFSDFDVPFEHFDNYIQLIDCPIVVDSLIIVEDKDNLEYVTNHFSSSDYKILLNKDDLNKNLDEYENEKKLKELEKHIGNNVLNKWKVLNYVRTEKKEGFYYHQVGYQRKGMNEKFWKRFCNDDIYDYALKENFEYASKCLLKKQLFESKADFELRKENFKNQFIDTYENGASFMSLSY
ncbi:MAG TPA: hypothetical protein VKY44_02875 [Flavobacterium sp.]|nr:hypothetical protein [Flavobacterium sp.]